MGGTPNSIERDKCYRHAHSTASIAQQAGLTATVHYSSEQHTAGDRKHARIAPKNSAASTPPQPASYLYAIVLELEPVCFVLFLFLLHVRYKQLSKCSGGRKNQPAPLDLPSMLWRTKFMITVFSTLLRRCFLNR